MRILTTQRALLLGLLAVMVSPVGAAGAEASSPSRAEPALPRPGTTPILEGLVPGQGMSVVQDAPFVVEISGPEAPAPGRALELEISIVRRFVTADPISVSIKLPAGVRLVNGELESQIVDAERSHIERRVRIAIGSELPSEELLVTVSQRASGWGAHATKGYRFGHEHATRQSPPQRDPRPVLLDGKRLGQPILVE